MENKHEDMPSSGMPRPDEVAYRSGEYAALEETNFWSWLRLTARLWGFLAFVLLIVILFRSVILPFILGGLAAFVLAPIVRFLDRVRIGQRHLPRFLWVIVLYLLLISGSTLFFTSFVPRLSKDFKRLIGEAPTFWSKIREDWVPQMSIWVETNVFPDFSPPVQNSSELQPALKPE